MWISLAAVVCSNMIFCRREILTVFKDLKAALYLGGFYTMLFCIGIHTMAYSQGQSEVVAYILADLLIILHASGGRRKIYQEYFGRQTLVNALCYAYLVDRRGGFVGYVLQPYLFSGGIWGMEPVTVEKVAGTNDIVPTLVSLMGFGDCSMYVGRNVFDRDYAGCVYCADGSWISGDSYYHDGRLVYGTMGQEEIDEMNRTVMEKITVNDRILQTDYYADWEKRDEK